MHSYALDHVSDATLLADLAALCATERNATAVLIAHIAEVDARELFKPTPYPSMFGYCTRVLHLAEAVAYKRIRAARVARKFPLVLDAIADGRVHVTGIAMLAPHITAENVNELIAAATHRTKHELEVLIARLAPLADVPATVRRLPAPRAQAEQLAVAPAPALPGTLQLDPDPVPAPRLESQPAAEAVRAPASRSARVKPLSPERFALQVTINQATRDKLERARSLLRHANPSGDLAEILDRALDTLLAEIEKKKFGKTSRPGPPKARPDDADPRYASNHVRRTVHARDEEQCTFVSADGERCTNRAFLEYDHRTLACRGGQPTVDGLGLMCKAHNQHEAERALGADFMRGKREAAKAARVTRRSARTTAPTTSRPAVTPTTAPPETARVSARSSDDVAAVVRGPVCNDAPETGEARTATADQPSATFEARAGAALAELIPTNAPE
ncbi:MAG TPA: hypothetical protein VM261_10670 [Kofleriaceae bacterium]|nr:hypothetical protein [Kofleriaceae bacterium]